MTRAKRFMKAAACDGGLFLSSALLVLAAISWVCLVDWRGPADELGAKQREHFEDCYVAAQRLGDQFARYRPDCADVSRAATVTQTRLGKKTAR